MKKLFFVSFFSVFFSFFFFLSIKMSVSCLILCDNGDSNSCLRAITAAKVLGESVRVSFLAPEKFSQRLNQFGDVVSVPDSVYSKCELAATAAKETIDKMKPSHVIGPATVFGKCVVPYLSTKYGCSTVSDVTKILSSNTFERTTGDGSMVETIKVKSKQDGRFVYSIKKSVFLC